MPSKRNSKKFNKHVEGEVSGYVIQSNGDLVSTGTNPSVPLNQRNKDKTEEELESNIVVTDSDLSILFNDVIEICRIPLHASPDELELYDLFKN